MGALLENAVYNELMGRGYEVYVEKKEYYQVTYYLYDQKVIDREFGVYTGIADNYPKYVISMDKPDFSKEGIIHLNALEFLKDELH